MNRPPKPAPPSPKIRRSPGCWAGSRINAGIFARAVQLLQESAPAFPQDGELLHQLGIAQYRMINKGKARATLTKRLSLPRIRGTPPNRNRFCPN
jgi:hypothetical protein